MIEDGGERRTLDGELFGLMMLVLSDITSISENDEAELSRGLRVKRVVTLPPTAEGTGGEIGKAVVLEGRKSL